MPKVTHTKCQSAFEAHSLCITLWLGTAIHNLPILLFHCFPIHPLLSILTCLLNVPNIPCALPLAKFSICNSPALGSPLLFKIYRSSRFCGKRVSPKFLLPLVAAKRLFYCYPRSVLQSAFLYLVLPPHLPQLYVT